MAHLACGCWDGPWWGVTPPAKCDYHAGFGWSSIGVAAAPSLGVGGTTTLKSGLFGAALDKTIAELLGEVEHKLLAATLMAENNGEAAQHDAYRIAIDTLRKLREDLVAAELAKSSK